MKTKIIVAEQWPGAETYYYWGEARMEHYGLHRDNPTTKIEWIWCNKTVEYPTPKDFERREITSTKEIENDTRRISK